MKVLLAIGVITALLIAIWAILLFVATRKS